MFVFSIYGLGAGGVKFFKEAEKSGGGFFRERGAEAEVGLYFRKGVGV